MAEKTKSLFDPSSIKQRYALLAAFLLAIEALLGAWFALAADSSERIVAGVLMTVLFLAFLGLVGVVESRRQESTGAPLPEDFDDLAKDEASVNEIENPAENQLAGPDGSYVIDQPPADWKIQKISFFDSITQRLGIEDPDTKQRLIDSFPVNAIVTDEPEKPNVLVFTADKPVLVAPTPGVSRINGRKVPTALTDVVETRLIIYPMAHARAPIYAERTTLENFLSVLAQNLNTGLVNLRYLKEGTLPGSERKAISAEFGQEIEDVTVDGVAMRSIRVNNVAVGIEGEVVDYLLLMTYPSKISDDLPAASRDLETLRALAASFRPLRLVDPEARSAELAELADKQFKKLMQYAGQKMFLAEIGLVFMRISGLDLEQAEDRLQAIRSLQPFQGFAKLVQLDEDMRQEFDRLWLSLEGAESGDSKEFKSIVQKILAEMKGASGKPEVKNLQAAGDASGDKMLPEPEAPEPDEAPDSDEAG